jgi:hypothetical protein
VIEAVFLPVAAGVPAVVCGVPPFDAEPGCA